MEAVLEIFRKLEPEHRDRLLKNVAASDPRLGEVIEQNLFRFEDLQTLEAAALQSLLRKSPEPVLSLALRNASPELLKTVYSNLSERAGAQLREAVAALGPRRLSDVQEAQRKILELGKTLGVISK